MKIRLFMIILILVLFFTVQFNAADVYGAEFVKGQSIIAEDQAKASLGLDFPGLNVTWFDIGDSHIQSYSQMDVFSEGIFTLNLSDETICFDTTGKIIAAGDYDGIYEFSDGMAKVYKYLPPAEPYVPGRIMLPPDTVEGFIDREGNEVIPIGEISNVGNKFHEGFALIGGYKQNKGYINKKGKIVIPQIYKAAGDFSEGLAAVQSVDTELWGYIDKDGELVIPMIYEGAAPFREEAACVVKDGLAGYIDKDGNVIIDFKFKSESDKYIDNGFYGGLAVVQDSSGKYGYINKNGDFVIPAKYKEAAPFIGEVAYVVSENQNYTNGYGSSFLINSDGERLTPLWQYGRYEGEYMREGLIRALSSYGPGQNEYIVMLNKYGTEIIPSSLKIDSLTSFNEGYALMIAHNNGGTAVGLVKKPENIETYKNSRIIKVFIDGKLLDFADTDPTIENSRTLVPMRAIFEALGAEVRWDDASKTVFSTKGNTNISLKIEDNTGYINNAPVKLDAHARIKNSRTIVPLRFVAESFNANVTWDDEERAVFINMPDNSSANLELEVMEVNLPVVENNEFHNAFTVAGDYIYFEGEGGIIYQTSVYDLSASKAVYELPLYTHGDSYVYPSLGTVQGKAMLYYHQGGANMGTDYRIILNDDGTNETFSIGYMDRKVFDDITVNVSYAVPPLSNNLSIKKGEEEGYKAVGNPDYIYGWLRMDNTGSIPSTDMYKIDDEIYILASIYDADDVTGIYRININTNETVRMCDESAQRFRIEENILYFMDLDGYLYKIPVGGNKAEKLTDFTVSNFTVLNNVVYYVAEDDKGLELFKLGESESVNPGGSVKELVSTNDYIYCIFENNSPYKLIVFNKEGTEVFKTNETIRFASVDRNRLFYHK